MSSLRRIPEGVAVATDGLSKRYLTTALDPFHVTAARWLRRRLTAMEDQRPRSTWALRDVSLEIRCGEVVGIIGSNGAGKTTLLKVLSRLTRPTSGSAAIRGRVAALIAVGTGFHPEMTGRENILVNGAVLGMSRREIAAKFDQIVDFAGVEGFIDTPVKWYSSGMQVRLGFAVAAHLDPEVLIIDEVLAVGDARFQRKCLGRLNEAAGEGRTVLFVSHQMEMVQSLCSRAIRLEQGQVVHQGPTSEVVRAYLSDASELAGGGEQLDERTDRGGNGRVRITRISYAGREGGRPNRMVAVGEALTILLHYRSDESRVRHLDLSIVVRNAAGTKIAVLDNRFRAQDIVEAPASGTVRCTIPRVPFIPGSYTIRVSANLMGELADRIDNASSFEVVDGDYFGEGQRRMDVGLFYCDQDWNVAEYAEVD